MPELLPRRRDFSNRTRGERSNRARFCSFLKVSRGDSKQVSLRVGECRLRRIAACPGSRRGGRQRGCRRSQPDPGAAAGGYHCAAAPRPVGSTCGARRRQHLGRTRPASRDAGPKQQRGSGRQRQRGRQQQWRWQSPAGRRHALRSIPAALFSAAIFHTRPRATDRGAWFRLYHRSPWLHCHQQPCCRQRREGRGHPPGPEPTFRQGRRARSTDRPRPL